MFKTIINPNVYHGKNKKENFFEGWYFKIVHPDEKTIYGFIPGIIMSRDQKFSHSFIQVLDGKETKFRYIKYPLEQFKSLNPEFCIKLENNSFSLEGISIDISHEDLSIRGELSFHNILEWPDSIINPGSMGFYNYLTFMQCYSQVCALNAFVKGTLLIKGELKDFTGGKVYIEKNWGRDFPSSYIWVQCNSFKTSNASLTASIAHIPFLHTSFTGFIIGLSIEEDFYEFSTKNLSKFDLSEGNEDVVVKAYNNKYTLSFSTDTQSDKYMTLFAPRDDKMVPIARETLQGITKVTLQEKSTHKILYEDTGVSSGVEFCGTYKELTKKEKGWFSSD